MSKSVNFWYRKHVKNSSYWYLFPNLQKKFKKWRFSIKIPKFIISIFYILTQAFTPELNISCIHTQTYKHGQLDISYIRTQTYIPRQLDISYINTQTYIPRQLDISYISTQTYIPRQLDISYINTQTYIPRQLDISYIRTQTYKPGQLRHILHQYSDIYT